MRADDRDHALDDGDEEGEDECEVAEFGNHLEVLSEFIDIAIARPLWALSTAAAAGGM